VGTVRTAVLWGGPLDGTEMVVTHPTLCFLTFCGQSLLYEQSNLISKRRWVYRFRRSGR
jgi:hypothetical protein